MTKPSNPPAEYEQRLDTTVRPQDDFFDYVNAKWLAKHPIPASESRWGAFNQLRDESWQNMREIYEELQQTTHAVGTVEQQARDLYYTGMHMDDFEKDHLALVGDYLARIDEIQDIAELWGVIGRLEAEDIPTFWTSWAGVDNDDSSRHIFRLYQPSLTLPDRDYYLQDNDKMLEIRKKYEQHLRSVRRYFPALAKSGAELWRVVWGFELAMAKASRSRADLRDIDKNYNRTTFTKLQQDFAGIDWAMYATGLGWEKPTDLSVDQPEYFTFLLSQVTERPLAEWKIYVKWRIVLALYGHINSKFAKLKFEFFGKVLGGTTQIMPQWKRVVLAIDSAMGEGVGRLYAKRHFPESSKQQVLDIVEELRDAYAARIDRLDWMSDKTKREAHKKLRNMKVLIGYPDKFRDFSKLRVTRDSYIGNRLAASRFDTAYHLAKLRRPTSRDDWLMYPQTVNAYHDPHRLVICFPAAILQKPFFDPKAPLGVNMGGIGMVIGHELTHGFDDQGCQFDATGTVRNWQQPAERAAFAERASVIIKQADKFQVLPGVHIKGKLVIGESIADLGGIEIAYEAMVEHLRRKDQLDQLSESSRLFFISFAITECGLSRDERAREMALSDPHPPERFRVNGILSHVESFYDTFEISSKDKLYRPPELRAKIW